LEGGGAFFQKEELEDELAPAYRLAGQAEREIKKKIQWMKI
jgi:hypothetical protein